MEYDPAHKTSSVTSTSSSTSSIWDPLPSLYTGRADSVSSAYDFDDLQEPEPFNEPNFHPIALNDENEQQQKSFNEFLNNFLEENQIKKVDKDNFPTLLHVTQTLHLGIHWSSRGALIQQSVESWEYQVQKTLSRNG